MSFLFPHALNLPLQLDAALRLHPAADFLAERLDIGAGSGAGVDEEIGVLLADLRAAANQPAAAGRVDKLPRLAPPGVLEGRNAGFRAQRLRRFAARRSTILLGLAGCWGSEVRMKGAGDAHRELRPRP